LLCFDNSSATQYKSQENHRSLGKTFYKSYSLINCYRYIYFYSTTTNVLGLQLEMSVGNLINRTSRGQMTNLLDWLSPRSTPYGQFLRHLCSIPEQLRFK